MSGGTTTISSAAAGMPRGSRPAKASSNRRQSFAKFCSAVSMPKMEVSISRPPIDCDGDGTIIPRRGYSSSIMRTEWGKGGPGTTPVLLHKGGEGVTCANVSADMILIIIGRLNAPLLCFPTTRADFLPHVQTSFCVCSDVLRSKNAVNCIRLQYRKEEKKKHNRRRMMLHKCLTNHSYCAYEQDGMNRGRYSGAKPF